MNIEEIQNALAKSATIFQTGGFRPSDRLDESWIGKVFLYAHNETIPLDSTGEQMYPLAQLYLPNLPYRHPILYDIDLITVFISPEYPKLFFESGKGWVVREYKSVHNLDRKELKNNNSYIKAFPLRPEFIERDYPLWDGGGVPDEIANEISRLRTNGEIDNYYDIIEHSYLHKIGGYPSFCQSGVSFGDGFEFVFQISSDAKARLNVIDGGSLMFAKNPGLDKWKMYFDFH